MTRRYVPRAPPSAHNDGLKMYRYRDDVDNRDGVEEEEEEQFLKGGNPPSTTPHHH